jgi:hypothetical protein
MSAAADSRATGGAAGARPVSIARYQGFVSRQFSGMLRTGNGSGGLGDVDPIGWQLKELFRTFAVMNTNLFKTES